MRVVLGGTFSPLHKGHKALFRKAFELGAGDKVIIGLTSDSLANAQRTRTVLGYSVRKQQLEEYLQSLSKQYPNTTIDIREIKEVFNVNITQNIDAEAFVVSEGRAHIAKETNELRKKHGKSPLEIVAVPYVLAMDGEPIKATRIAAGEIDTDGRLLKTVKVVVGTENDVKLSAVRNVFIKIFSDLEVTGTAVASGVSTQPFDNETLRGALNRALAASKQVPDAHFSVGIEAGLIRNDEANQYFDVQYCVVRDHGGRETVGHGSGFYYPDMVIENVKSGKTVGEVMSALTGTTDIGKKQGAIGHLSTGLLTREVLTEQAVLMALVPRLTEMYD
jgi:pantetheine-phosphate adenylyltransferase